MQVFEETSLVRAKNAIRKRNGFRQRKLLWIKRVLLEKIVSWCEENGRFKEYALLFIISYAFLLRLPAEALPIEFCDCAGQSSYSSRAMVSP